MGIYVDPKNVAFRKALNADIYIDKTELIAYTNDRIDKTDCFLCVSRPRRFGKSMAVDMLVAYYSTGCDSRALFAGKKVEEDLGYGPGKKVGWVGGTVSRISIRVIRIRS